MFEDFNNQVVSKYPTFAWFACFSHFHQKISQTKFWVQAIFKLENAFKSWKLVNTNLDFC